MVSARVITDVAKLGLATAGLAIAFAAMGQPSGEHAGHHAGHGGQGPAASAAAPAGGATTGAAPGAPAAATPAAAADTVAKGRELFNTFACGSCHVLADADASSPVGPPLDGNPNLTKEFIVDRVTNGQGAMPAFGGQLTDEEIALLADYIVQVAAK